MKSRKRNGFYNDFFKIDEAQIEHERFDGTMQTIKRLCFERGDAVAAVVFDPKTNELLFTEQFRYPAYSRSGESTMIELVAGMLNPNEDRDNCLKREMQEELGYSINRSEYLGCYFLSPGGSSERVHLYFVKLGGKIGNGGGLLEENEDIRVIRVKAQKLLVPESLFLFNDAKTRLGLLLSQKMWS